MCTQALSATTVLPLCLIILPFCLFLFSPPCTAEQPDIFHFSYVYVLFLCLPANHGTVACAVASAVYMPPCEKGKKGLKNTSGFERKKSRRKGPFSCVSFVPF